jgi:hypothetical protein
MALWYPYVAICIFFSFVLVGARWKFNAFTLFLPTLLLCFGVGLPYSYELNVQAIGYEISDHGWNDYILASAILFAGIPLGILVANLLIAHCAVPKFEVPTEVRFRPSFYTKVYLILLAGAAVFSFGIIIRDGINLDLFDVASWTEYSDYAAHRYGFAERATGPWYWVYNHLGYCLAPIGVILMATAPGIAWWLRVMFFALIAGVLVQTGHKMPLVMLGIYIVIGMMVARYGFRQNFRVWAYIAVVFIGLQFAALPMLYMFFENLDYQAALGWSLHRTTLELPRCLQLYVEVFPHVHPYLYGDSTSLVASLMGSPESFVSPGQYIPNDVFNIKQTSWPAGMIADAWADAGPVGAFIVTICSSAMLQGYNLWYFRRKYVERIDSALLTAVAINSVFLLQVNMLTSLLTYGLIAMAVIVTFIRYGDRQLLLPGGAGDDSKNMDLKRE